MNTFVLSLLMSLCHVTFELLSQLYHLRLPGFYLGPSACPKIHFIRLCFEIRSPQYDCGFVSVSAKNVEILAHGQIPLRSISLELYWGWSRVSSSFMQTFASHITGKTETLFLSVTYLKKPWSGQNKGWKLRYMNVNMCGRWSTSWNQPKPLPCQSPPVSTKVARWQCTCENRWIKLSQYAWIIYVPPW